MSSTPAQTTEPADPKRRIHSRVALSLLEALRDQDLPTEVLDDENLTVTLPRRLGLSGVVDTQIRRYREDARRRRRVPEHEVHDLIQLVLRRPDAREVFRRVGRDLHARGPRPGLRRFLPRVVARRVALRRIGTQLRALFGRRLVQGSRSPFRFRAVDSLLTRSDPGGEACAIVTGLARTELARMGGEPGRLVHVACRGLGDEECVWGLVDPDPADGESERTANPGANADGPPG